MTNTPYNFEMQLVTEIEARSYFDGTVKIVIYTHWIAAVEKNDKNPKKNNTVSWRKQVGKMIKLERTPSADFDVPIVDVAGDSADMAKNNAMAMQATFSKRAHLKDFSVATHVFVEKEGWERCSGFCENGKVHFSFIEA